MGRTTSMMSRSLRNRLTILMVLTATAGLLVTMPAFIAYTQQALQTDAERELETTARVVAATTTAALTFSDAGTATELLAALRAKPAVTSACLYRAVGDSELQLFASYAAGSVLRCEDQSPPQTAESAVARQGESLIHRLVHPHYEDAEIAQGLLVTVPVTLDRSTIGALRITQSLASLDLAMRKQIGFGLLVLAASVALTFVTALRTQSSITRPIFTLAETARRISLTHDYSLRAPVDRTDEIGNLAKDFNRMLMQIASYDAEVQASRRMLADEVEQTSAANNKLSHALLDLKRTQTQLVQSEKMASLGALVAGVAHEINTPVGVAVTAASTLTARADQVRAQYAEKSLKRSDLERFLDLAQQSCDILLKNLQRAADLVSSFKRVAVDQSSDERRRFGLRSYIAETLTSLAPTYRKQGCTVEVIDGPEIEIDSYPGAIAQVLTNLISNSLVHAFDHTPGGHMTIELSGEDDDVVLRYTDDGKGIPEDALPRVFDPFFTTRRSAGGSGLGLHIVFNLVSQQLGGTITAGNTAAGGAEFVVRFPRNTRST